MAIRFLSTAGGRTSDAVLSPLSTKLGPSVWSWNISLAIKPKPYNP